MFFIGTPEIEIEKIVIFQWNIRQFADKWNSKGKRPFAEGLRTAIADLPLLTGKN
jgi:hypothetical protein